MENLSPQFLQAETLMKAGSYQAAFTLFSAAIKAEPNNPVYYSQRGVCYFHLKDLKSALKDMNKSVELDPDYSYRYASRAYIKDASGDVLGAIADYQKAVELDPEDAVSYNNLGLLEEKLGYMESSKKSFKKADDLAKMLEETGIVTERELLESVGEKPTNIQKEIDAESEEQTSSSLTQEIGNVFKKKDVFKEFVQFIKNGFKTKE
ncbi:MAG: tetratricopeptide repeat protein [Flavobacteriales bacterium]